MKFLVFFIFSRQVSTYFDQNALFQVYIILFRPYKNTRASIMQRLRGLSQVECMEWINEVKSRSPPGIFSISKGKVLNPWLKIRELSSKSLGAPTSVVLSPTTLNRKTAKPIEKCIINAFSCGTSAITYDNRKTSHKQVHENNSISFRMKLKTVPFAENPNLDKTDKGSIIFHETMSLCRNDDSYRNNNNDNTNKF